MKFKTFDAGEPIIQTGTRADEFFIVVSGTVEVRGRIDGRRHQRLDVFFSRH